MRNKCNKCEGTGDMGFLSPMLCDECEGKGVVASAEGIYTDTITGNTTWSEYNAITCCNSNSNHLITRDVCSDCSIFDPRQGSRRHLTNARLLKGGYYEVDLTLSVLTGQLEDYATLTSNRQDYAYLRLINNEAGYINHVYKAHFMPEETLFFNLSSDKQCPLLIQNMAFNMRLLSP